MHFPLWRRCGAMLFLVTALLPLGAQATNRVASVIAYGRSITMSSTSASVPGVPNESVRFATYDGTNSFPLHTGNSEPFNYNGEVRPRSGQTGTYETDYLLLSDGFSREYGTLTFTLPTTDSDTNGVPDFLQADKAVNTALTGSGTIHATRLAVATNTIAVAVNLFTRAENELKGDFSLSMNTSGRSAVTASGKWILWQLSGSAFYERETRNKLSLGLMLTNGNGSSLSYTGSTTYVVSNTSQLSLPAMTLKRGDGNNITLAAMTLTRSGRRYSGVATLSDGTLGTPWVDLNTFNLNITDDHDADTNGIPDLTDISEAPDTVAPKVAFTVPSAFAKVTNAVLTVYGTASDEVGLKRVEVQYGTNAAQSMGTSNFWSARVNLDLGTNQILARAYDYRGHTSTVSRYFIRLPISLLNLTWTPGGTVTPNLNSNVLIVGQRYTLTAKPSSKFLFASWTGGVATNVARLTFTMESNLVLQANFVTNEFLGVKGTYQGLFDDTNAPAHETAGFFKATVSDKGGYSGSLKQGTKTYSFGGHFELDGKSTNRIKFQKTNTLVAVICLDLTNGLNQITGTLASSNVNARILATRPIYKSGVSNAPFAGRYTMNFASTPAPANPAGLGVLTVVADNAGTTTIAGKLGEGTATSQKVPASHDGLMPYYQSLSSGRGSIFGWLRFTNDGPDTLAGSLLWTKPSAPNDKLYRDGFTNSTTAFGSTYSSVLMTSLLATATNLEAQITGLTADPINNSLTMSAKNTFTSTNGLKLKLDLKTGLWTGTFPEPTTRKALPVNATLLQQRGNGGGYALGTNVSASVRLLLQ